MNYQKKNSIKNEIWKYLIIFSILILGFLWIFQVVLLPSYYENSKTKELEKVVSSLSHAYYTKDNIKDFFNNVANIAHTSGVCVIISDTLSNVDYTTDSFNIECMQGKEFTRYKNNFIASNQQKDKIITTNPKFENKTLVYSLRLDNNIYIFTSSSLVPIDSTVYILRKQLIIVSIIVLALALLVSYFISEHLSKPIIKLTNATKEFGKNKDNQDFDIDSNLEEISELAQTLKYASKEIAQTEELRQDLMANVSHDLKTPLTMIKAYTEMVRDITYNDTEKREKNLNVIIEEVDRLNNLVNDILTLSVMESKMMNLNIEEFDLHKLIKNILSRYEIFSINQEYNFIYNYNQDCQVTADKQKIEQVLYNLINNAIQYTGDDKIIEISLKDENNNYLVEIKNTGPIIPKEDLINIWNRYYKSNKNHKRAPIGTGLGLSIVKQILDLHNFEYGVTSNEKEGTIFYFKIRK